MTIDPERLKAAIEMHHALMTGPGVAGILDARLSCRKVNNVNEIINFTSSSPGVCTLNIGLSYTSGIQDG